MVKRKVTDLDKTKIDEQKKAVRSGYDIDILPSSLEAYGVDVKKLLQSLESHDEHLFMVTFLPSRSMPWIPVVPSCIGWILESLMYCSTGNSELYP